jgi:hypothetical protein
VGEESWSTTAGREWEWPSVEIAVAIAGCLGTVDHVGSGPREEGREEWRFRH